MQNGKAGYVVQIALANRGDLDTSAAAKELATELHDKVNEILEQCPSGGSVEINAIHYTATADGRPALRIITDLECAAHCALQIIFERGLIDSRWMPGDFFPVIYGAIPATSLALVGEQGAPCA